MAHSKHLDEVLSWSSFAEQSSSPSWVPDWATSFGRYQIQWLRRRQAAGDTVPTWTLSEISLELRVKGIIVEIIEHTGFSPVESISCRKSKQPEPKYSTKQPAFGRYRNKFQLGRALNCTLIQAHANARQHGDVLEIYWIDWDQVEAASDWDTQLEVFWTLGMRETVFSDKLSSDTWEIFDRFRQTNSNTQVFGYILRDFFPSMREYHVYSISSCAVEPVQWKHSPHTLTYNHAFNMKIATLALNGRRLITTMTGLLGLAPEEPQKADVVAILYGCNFPVVLRRSGNAFGYVGECYIDGLMNGEAIEAQKRGEYEETEVIIC